jgi:hypothetical protein
MIFIVILLIIIIVWLQYPQYNNCDNKDKPQHIQLFNAIKIPVVVICFILIICSSFMYINNSIPSAYVSVPKY